MDFHFVNFSRRFYSLENGFPVIFIHEEFDFETTIVAGNPRSGSFEYALMAGFVAVTAGAIMPGVASSISTIVSQVGSVMAIASTQG